VSARVASTDPERWRGRHRHLTPEVPRLAHLRGEISNATLEIEADLVPRSDTSGVLPPDQWGYNVDLDTRPNGSNPENTEYVVTTRQQQAGDDDGTRASWDHPAVYFYDNGAGTRSPEWRTGYARATLQGRRFKLAVPVALIGDPAGVVHCSMNVADDHRIHLISDTYQFDADPRSRHHDRGHGQLAGE
jgi:hypothetical protein